jgi:hypothetical protein
MTTKATPANKAPANAADILAEAGEVFGEPLKENVQYVIHSWTTRAQHFDASGDRPAREGVQLNLLMSIVGQEDAEPQMYRCFSAVLKRQLDVIGQDNLPVVASFERRETNDGRTDETGRRFAAWSIRVN